MRSFAGPADLRIKWWCMWPTVENKFHIPALERKRKHSSVATFVMNGLNFLSCSSFVGNNSLHHNLYKSCGFSLHLFGLSFFSSCISSNINELNRDKDKDSKWIKGKHLSKIPVLHCDCVLHVTICVCLVVSFSAFFFSFVSLFCIISTCISNHWQSIIASHCLYTPLYLLISLRPHHCVFPPLFFFFYNRWGVRSECHKPNPGGERNGGQRSPFVSQLLEQQHRQACC